MKIALSKRHELLRILEGCGDDFRDETWEARGSTTAEGTPSYDRRRAARRLTTAFARASRVPKDRLVELEDALAASLPPSMEDIDGFEVLEWLEREIPIEWKDDHLALPDSLRSELATMILEALSQAREGEMTPDQRSCIARRVFELVLPNGRTASQRKSEAAFAEIFIQLAWGARREPEARVIRAVEWLESELKIRWESPQRGERAYSASDAYDVGDVVVHPRFGRGVVQTRTDTSIDVEFSDGNRRLAAARRLPDRK